MHYVYQLTRPYPPFTPCYIGVGSNGRVFEHDAVLKKGTHQNSILQKIFNKSLQSGYSGLTAKILEEGFSWEEGCKREKELIAKYGRLSNGTGCLANLTDGGEGFTGATHSLETRTKMSKSHKGKVKTPEHLRAISLAKKGKTFFSEESRRKMSESHRGRIPWNKGTSVPRIRVKKGRPEHYANFGRPLSEAHKKAISLSRKGQPHPHKGVPRSAETREKIGLAKRSQPSSAGCNLN